MSARELQVTISVLVPMSVTVYAKRNDCGEVEIESVASVNGLPTVREIEESMGEDDFAALDEAFEEVERAK